MGNVIQSTVNAKYFPQATTLGGRLRWLRKQREATLREFASRIGCDPSYLSKLEAGKATKPTLRFLVSVTAAFRVSADWLRTGEGDPFGDPMSDAATKESLSGWSSERVARVMEVLDDLQPALAPERVLAALVADKSLEEVRALWNQVGGLGLPVTARLFWNDAFMSLQFQILGRTQVSQNKVLTQSSTSAKLPPVKSQLDNLLAALNRLTKEPGTKTALADYLGAPLASVSRWLSGEREPGGETTLKMLRWVQEHKSH